VNLGAKPVSETPQALPAGLRLGDGDRYEIRQRIGIGGMAEVYKGVDTRLGNRIVAIKTLSASVAEHPFAARMRSLFIQEAQALSRVKDENVVDVLDFGTAADGTPYMVMEFLNGMDLGVFLKKNKQVTIEQAVDVMLGVCAGVHACHLAGIIHRDLKPANIFLTRTLKGELTKVLDFSVAKVPIARSTPPADQMKTDLIVGTPTYMSPEQALGKPANELSDQYSVGALLYRCLTGRPPQGVLPRPRELRPEIPERLEAVILRALEAIPDKRFATVHDLGHGLLPFASSAGRGRWRPYYRTPPLPVDPTTTGSFSPSSTPPANPVVAAEPASVPSAPATVAANYDFKAHERTTSLDSDAKNGRLPEGARPTGTTAVNQEPLSGSATSASGALTTVDVPISVATGLSGADRVATVPPSEARPTSPSVARGRRRFLAAFGAIAVLVLAVTLAGLRSTRRHDVPSVAPAAPEWTRTAAPASAPPVVPPPAVKEPAPPPAAVQGNAAPTVTAPEPPVRDRAPSPAPPRPKRRHQPKSTTETIQYGSDGMPILH
jgi:serine/threonine-protein kinase